MNDETQSDNSSIKAEDHIFAIKNLNKLKVNLETQIDDQINRRLITIGVWIITVIIAAIVATIWDLNSKISENSWQAVSTI
jgi:hypothetical protein